MIWSANTDAADVCYRHLLSPRRERERERIEWTRCRTKDAGMKNEICHASPDLRTESTLLFSSLHHLSLHLLLCVCLCNGYTCFWFKAWKPVFSSICGLTFILKLTPFIVVIEHLICLKLNLGPQRHMDHHMPSRSLSLKSTRV